MRTAGLRSLAKATRWPTCGNTTTSLHDVGRREMAARCSESWTPVFSPSVPQSAALHTFASNMTPPGLGVLCPNIAYRLESSGCTTMSKNSIRVPIILDAGSVEEEDDGG